jgi:hypothetical protein
VSDENIAVQQPKRLTTTKLHLELVKTARKFYDVSFTIIKKNSLYQLLFFSSYCLFFGIGSCYVVQAGLELSTGPLPKCWDYRFISYFFVFLYFINLRSRNALNTTTLDLYSTFYRKKFFLAILWMNPRALHMLGRHPTTELHPQFYRKLKIIG